MTSQDTERAREALVKAGFQVKNYLTSKHTHQTFRVSKRTQDFFVKVCVDNAWRENILTQMEADAFVRSRRPRDASFVILDSEMIESDGTLIAVFPWTNARPLIDQQTHQIYHSIDSHVLDVMAEIILFYRSIPYAELPLFFKRWYEQNGSFERYAEKFLSYTEPALGKLISQAERSRLLALMREIGYRQEFQHHDFTPWNFLLDDHGRIMLVDAEYTRWGMKWYDVATFLNQTCVNVGDMTKVRSHVRAIIKRLQRVLPNEPIERELLFPLAYLVGGTCKTSLGNPAAERRTKIMLKRILTGELSEVLR